MSRRTLTLAVTGALLVALIAVASLLPVPYVVYSPGPTEDTLGEQDGVPVIEVDGAETYPTDGELDLTTVGITPVDGQVDVFTALRAWMDDERAIFPRDLIYPPDLTAEQRREQNAAMLQRSQDDAKAAALRHLGYDVPGTVLVDMVLEDMPADGNLMPGDELLEVDGTSIEQPEDVVEVVQAHAPGDEIEFVIDRSGEEVVLDIVTTEAENGDHAFVGFAPVAGYEFPVDINVTIDDRIGGPSAGMVFALAIYDTLTPGALLDGLHVAGTGEITGDGDVGPIGGIQQKIAAAANEGADLFLAPVENCDDVPGAAAHDMQIVSVDMLDDAIAAVEAAAAGEEAGLPSCG
ncbi:MAG TPA: S16 family serine protease [Jiangellaceae bacterium]